jgi:hypothetical protein
VGGEVEIVSANSLVCVAAADTRLDDGNMTCLSGKDPSEYDYINVSRDGLVPVNMKMSCMTRLNDLEA